MNVQFVHQLLPMFLDRLDADEQLAGDLFVGIAFGNQLQHLQLARGEFRGFLLARWPADRCAEMFQQTFGNGGTEKGVAFFRLADGSYQVLSGSLFDQVSGSAGVSQLLHILVVAVGREDEHFGFWTFPADLPGRLQPVERWHRNVHDDDFGLQAFGHLHRLAAVFSLADDGHVVFGFEQSAEALPDYGVIVRQ